MANSLSEIKPPTRNKHFNFVFTRMIMNQAKELLLHAEQCNLKIINNKIKTYPFSVMCLLTRLWRLGLRVKQSTLKQIGPQNEPK